MAVVTRRQTRTVRVGGVPVGSAHPIVVQSMTNTDTADIPATIHQVAALARAGSEIVRVTVNNEDAAAAVPHIVAGLAKVGITVPIVGDFHYNGHLLLTKHPECARALAKYRINPGNVGGKRHDEHFRAIVARYRPRPAAEAYLRLRTLPGEQGQVDWAHFGRLRVRDRLQRPAGRRAEQRRGRHSRRNRYGSSKSRKSFSASAAAIHAATPGSARTRSM